MTYFGLYRLNFNAPLNFELNIITYGKAWCTFYCIHILRIVIIEEILSDRANGHMNTRGMDRSKALTMQ